MDRYRTVRRDVGRRSHYQPSRRPIGATHTPVQTPRQKFSNILLLLRLMQQYSWVLLLGTWVLSLLVAGIAMTEMVKVDLSEQPTNQPASIAPVTSTQELPDAISQTEQPQRQKGQPEGQTLPIVSLGAIALSCAAGCLLFSQRLSPRQPTKRLEFSSASRKTPTRQFTSSVMSETKLKPQQHPDSGIQAIVPSAAVTVLPSNQSHPLDWDEPSLADSLDIRQRRPLSHWL